LRELNEKILQMQFYILVKPGITNNESITTRGGGEDTTFKAKGSEKVQGQGPSCRGQVA